MKQKTITLPHCELLVMEVPKGAGRPHLFNDVGGPYISYFIGVETYRVYLKQFGISEQLELLGRLPEITEDQAVRAVDESIHSGLYAHYVKEVNPPNVYRYRSSRDSLASLLTSHDVYFENSLGEEPDSGDEFYRDALGITSNYWSDLLEWQEVQSKVFDKERTYLFIKVD